jgi:hypothetical protein
MSVPENLSKLVGEWRGTNRLHLSWMAESPFISESKAIINFSAKGIFLKIEYDWIYENSLQEGMILIGREKDSDLIKSFWIDSWHLSDKFMVSESKAKNGGAISVKGYYTVPDQPDWGWRTVIDSENADTFRIKMYNVSPDGEESLAVEADYKRLK